MNPINNPQYAENWGFLGEGWPLPGKPSYPTNLDGLTFHTTERGGHFLVLEVKRGERQTKGQYDAILAMSVLPMFDILLVHSEWDEPDGKNTRRVIPVEYCKLIDGVEEEWTPTTIEDFRQRYWKWFGSQPRRKVEFIKQYYKREGWF